LTKNLVAIPALVLGIAALAHAQAPAAAAPATAAPAAYPVKVAVINVQGAILSTADGKKATADLTAKFTPRRSVLEKKNSDMQTKQDQVKKGGATMNADAKDKLTKEIEALQKSLQRDTEDFDADVQQEENKIMNDLGEKMMAIVIKHCQQNGIGMVINVSDQSTPVLWADPALDITQEIIRLYDTAYPPQVSPTATAAKPAAGQPAAPAKLPVAPPATKKQ
jgi:outer membrane protein